MLQRLLTFLGLASSKRHKDWPRVRAAHLRREPVCQICGTDKDLDVHHVVPVHEDASLELLASNLLTLCRHDHFVWGHLCDWRVANRTLRADVRAWRRRLEWRA